MLNTHRSVVGIARMPRIEAPPRAWGTDSAHYQSQWARARLIVHTPLTISAVVVVVLTQPTPALSVDTGQALILFARPAGSAGLV